MNYPDISKIISIDIETYDPEIKKLGTGVYRHDGYVLGYSIAFNDFSEYYNLGHDKISIDELRKNMNYIEYILASDSIKIFANGMYDLDWLTNFMPLQTNAQYRDIFIAEHLLDEYAKISLDYLAEKYLSKKKEKTEIEAYCENKGLKGDARNHLYRMPYALVKKYAKIDAELPLKIHEKQIEKIKNEGLLQVYKLEMSLYPLLLQMRKTGVKIDIEKLEKNKKKLEKIIKNKEKNLFATYGEFNYRSPDQLASKLLKEGCKLEQTENSIQKEKEYNENKRISALHTLFPDFTANEINNFKRTYKTDKKILQKLNNKLANTVLDLKKDYKIYNDFFCKALANNVNGIVHGSFHQTGCSTGRFSSTKPNLQQIPKSKKHEYSKLCRELFIPFENCCWGKIDYSQVEYRVLAHYATGPGSDGIRLKYNKDSKTDYHQYVADISGLSRDKEAKNMNFGLAYGMGIATMANTFNWTFAQAKKLNEIYNNYVPFVRHTMNRVIEEVKKYGFVKTILGRKQRMTYQQRQEDQAYRFFNAKIQGSAADIMKLAMSEAYKKGVFNVLHPHLTVHDELDVSIHKTKEGIEAFIELQRTMQECIKLKVPLIADCEIGENWSNVSEIKYEKMKNDFKLI